MLLSSRASGLGRANRKWSRQVGSLTWRLWWRPWAAPTGPPPSRRSGSRARPRSPPWSCLCPLRKKSSVLLSTKKEVHQRSLVRKKWFLLSCKTSSRRQIVSECPGMFQTDTTLALRGRKFMSVLDEIFKSGQFFFVFFLLPAQPQYVRLENKVRINPPDCR